jgi:ABC-type lipoprotein release transport system permease subunit
MAAVFFAVVLSTVLITLSDGTFDNMIKNVVGYYSGYIQVHKQGYWDDQTLENALHASPALEDSIKKNKDVIELTPRLESFSLAASGDVTRGVMVVGVDPERENLITHLRAKLTKGSYLNNTGAPLDEVLLCEGLAQRLNLTVNDTLLLIGQGYHGATAAGRYLVKGILHYGSPDLNERMLFMSLPSAQQLYSAEGMITTYVLMLNESADLDKIAGMLREDISKAYEVMTWDEIMPELKQHIKSDTTNANIFLGFLYVLVTMGIFGTMLMMMIERRYELGMLIAIGMKKRKLIVLLTAESVLTVMAGCMAGMLVSIPLVYYLNIHPIRFTGELAKAYERFGFEAVMPTSTEPYHFIVQALAVLCIGLVLSLYPIWKVLRLDPVMSMKR